MFSIAEEYGWPSSHTELKIRVTDAKGTPISEASVASLSQPEGQEALKCTTDTDGSMIFTDVRPGNYMIQASKSGYTTDTGIVKAELEVAAELTIFLKMELKGITGFPYKSIILGIAIEILRLWWMRRRT